MHLKMYLKLHVKFDLKVNFLTFWSFLLPIFPPLLFLREVSSFPILCSTELRIQKKSAKVHFKVLLQNACKSAFKNTCKSAFKNALFDILVIFVTKSPPFAFFKRRIHSSFVFSYRIKDYKKK